MPFKAYPLWINWSSYLSRFKQCWKVYYNLNRRVQADLKLYVTDISANRKVAGINMLRIKADDKELILERSERKKSSEDTR